MRIAYLIGRYPAVSHTFIMREIQALRQLGTEIETFAIWRTDPAELLSAADRDEFCRTRALLPPRVGGGLAAHARAATRRPGAYVRALGRALALSRPGVRGRLLGLSWFFEAVVLWGHCVQRGIRHIHVHLGGTAPTVALLAVSLANGGRGKGNWTWSFTVHGPAEFYDVVRERLAVKVRNAAFVVCISDFARSQLMALVDESEWDRLHVVHCGVDPAVFDGEAERSAATDGPLRALSVGRLTRMKGHALLLDAVAMVRSRGVDLQLTIVGDGPKRGDLERRAAARGLDHQVTWAGAVPGDRVRDFYSSADVFCLGSFGEGVPVVLMEAMAMGLPVIAPRIMGIPELVEDGTSGRLYTPGRVDRLADALAELAVHPELRASMGRAGRATVVADFDTMGSARRLEELLRACARS